MPLVDTRGFAPKSSVDMKRLVLFGVVGLATFSAIYFFVDYFTNGVWDWDVDTKSCSFGRYVGSEEIQDALGGKLVRFPLENSAEASYQHAAKSLFVWGPEAGAKRLFTDDAHRALYRNRRGSAWRLAQFAVTHGFDELKLFIGSIEYNKATFSKHKLHDEYDLAKLIHVLNENGIEAVALSYVADDVNDASGAAGLSDLVFSVSEFNKRWFSGTECGFQGVDIDQEPNDSSQYGILLGGYEAARAAAVAAARDNKQRSRLAITATVKPQWVTEAYGDYSTFLGAASMRIDKTTLLGYTRPKSALLALANQYAENSMDSSFTTDGGDSPQGFTAGVPAAGGSSRREVAVETGWIGVTSEDETWHRWIVEDRRRWLGTVAELNSELANSRTFGESASRLALHSYSQLYESLYGVSPYRDTENRNNTFFGGDAVMHEFVAP